MSSTELSEDDDSFELPNKSKVSRSVTKQEIVTVSSNDEASEQDSDATVPYNISSDEEDLPPIVLKAKEIKRENIIKNLFTKQPKARFRGHLENVPSTSIHSMSQIPSNKKMIGGVEVDFPVPPYGAQIALMSKVIEGISKRLNCLLESPTGSGKTLALLCGAMAWQRHERKRLDHTHESHTAYPGQSGMNSPAKIKTEELFNRPAFGDKNIYDKPVTSDSAEALPKYGSKRQESGTDWSMDSPDKGLVSIHKRRKMDGVTGEGSKTSLNNTPKKQTLPEEFEAPQNIRVPKIYYGARTHKQIQQVVKEFARTSYCGDMKMTVLSSRDYSCIRPFDRSIYQNKNDMCKECIKKVKKDSETTLKDKDSSNCKYYDNRKAMGHDTMPPAFDLDDLVAAGEEMNACPYYGARHMAAEANIVFCPYNYLIDPSIRSSMQIDIRDAIVILDEAHNIEDICRDSATYTLAKDQVVGAVKELTYLTSLKYANQDFGEHLERLLSVLQNMDDWFVHQLPLVRNQPVIGDEAVYVWRPDHFITTLNNHNIGVKHYNEIRTSAEMFGERWREDPSTMYGITQPTATLIESISLVLGFLFREECKHADDFVPALVLGAGGGGDSEPGGWRSAREEQTTSKETLSLRMLCMNPGVIFSALLPARCIVLSSGTLTPKSSLHSELEAKFPLQISPNHVIARERVWIGTLTTCPNGRVLECKSAATSQTDTQDAIGETVLWVSQVTPNGVLVFLPSYTLMNRLVARWKETNLWRKLVGTKRVFMESRNVRDHNDIMDDYYKYSAECKGALLFAVFRGKVSEGMDFKDHQARAVITVGIPYPNTFDMAVKQKMLYNDRHSRDRQLLTGSEWLRVQAYRALNQAVGRCVRHRSDWGAVLLLDARFGKPYYTEHLSKWVNNFLGNNHHTFESLVNSADSIESFMQRMTLSDKENI